MPVVAAVVVCVIFCAFAAELLVRLDEAPNRPVGAAEENMAAFFVVLSVAVACFKPKLNGAGVVLVANPVVEDAVVTTLAAVLLRPANRESPVELDPAVAELVVVEFNANVIDLS